jgi:hypothetical protein
MPSTPPSAIVPHGDARVTQAPAGHQVLDHRAEQQHERDHDEHGDPLRVAVVQEPHEHPGHTSSRPGDDGNDDAGQPTTMRRPATAVMVSSGPSQAWSGRRGRGRNVDERERADEDDGWAGVISAPRPERRPASLPAVWLSSWMSASAARSAVW